MSMRDRVEEYLALRRFLGFKLQTEERMLMDFAARIDRTGQRTVTVEVAVAWASEPSDASAVHRHRRLAVRTGDSDLRDGDERTALPMGDRGTIS